MLTAIRAIDFKTNLAENTKRTDGPFLCPECKAEVILRKGNIKIHHFAHKPPTSCEYGAGESEEHRRCKTEIYNELLKIDYLTVEMEKKIGNVRPDIYLESKRTNKRYAVEVQLSNLSVEKITARTREYARLGVYVLWLPQFSQALRLDKYSPIAWERWLHTTYYGRVYYWSRGLTIIPVRFEGHKLHVEYAEWYETGGELVSVGGYDRYSKRYKTPVAGKPIRFPGTFHGVDRGSWVSKDAKIIVPACKILIEQKDMSK